MVRGDNMRKKYKIKRKHYISVSLVLIVIILLFMTMGTGYSLWSSKLYINGTVTSDYKEPKLENLDIVAQRNDKLITVKDSYFINAFSVGDTSKFDDDTFGVKGKVNISVLTLTKRTLTVTMQFINNNDIALTDGEIENLENSKNLTLKRPSVTPKTVQSKETSTVTVEISEITASSSGANLKYRICYKINGVRRYMYLIINT